MHLMTLFAVIFAAWKWSDWRNWKNYLPTMQYIVIGALLYEYLTDGQKMWVFQGDIPDSQTVTALIHQFFTMPLTVLIFLSNFPKTLGKQCYRISKWIGLYAAVEIIMLLTGRITYDNGWTLWHSIGFDIMMFPMLRLHHSRPLLAYLISVPIVLFLNYRFNIYVE